jgi:hypothetical protein
MQGQGACRRCAPNAPLAKPQAWERAVAYRFRPDDPDAFESTNTPRMGTFPACGGPVNPCLGRFQVHTCNGWEVLYTRQFTVGLHARLVEGAVKRLWFGERGWKNGAARGEQPSDGYTKTVLLEDADRGERWSSLTPLALWTDVLTET